MNEREIAEIRRRMRPDKNNIGRIRGCYVNDNHVIISEFDQTLGLISNDEAEAILSVLNRTLRGNLGRNLINISFSNNQVLDSEEHKLLSELRSSSLGNNDAVKSFFEKTISNLNLDGSYFIILANDKYDIFTYDENGEKNESSEMFSYIICAICPIKTAKPALGYSIGENKFKNIVHDSMVSSPEIGFMFPAYEAKCANIYNALYFTRDVSESHEEFTNAIFSAQIPKPAAEQTAGIANMFNAALTENCDIEFVQTVQNQLIELTADHKANKIAEPLMLSAKDMGSLLRCGGADEESIGTFSERFTTDFGDTTSIPPANVMDIKKFEVKTPEVTIKVKPEYSDLIETRIINGTKYLLIRADGEIEVNGISININE